MVTYTISIHRKFKISKNPTNHQIHNFLRFPDRGYYRSEGFPNRRSFPCVRWEMGLAKMPELSANHRRRRRHSDTQSISSDTQSISSDIQSISSDTQSTAVCVQTPKV